MATQGQTGADLVVDALEQYGVHHAFGNPGTTEMPLVQAISTSDIEYYLALHEDIAVGMAAGYASTRRYHSHHDSSVTPVGFVNLHTIAGMAHGMGNLYGAQFANVPIVVTAGTQAPEFQHEEPILSGDLARLTSQFTKWSDEVPHIDALAPLLRRAVRTALSPPTGPVFLGLPVSVMIEETQAEPEPLGAIPGAGSGDPGAVDQAANLLATGDEPVLVAGDGVAQSGDDAIRAAVRVAEAIGARVHGEIFSAEVNFPTKHDQWASYLPIANERRISECLDGDPVAFVGCSSNAIPTRLAVGSLVPDGVTCIDINIDSWEIGKNTPADVSILGDPGHVLSTLADQLQGRVPNDVRDQRVSSLREWTVNDTESSHTDESGDALLIKPELVEAIRSAAPDAYIIDGAYGGREGKYEMTNRWEFAPEEFLSNKGSGLGYAVPAAIGAAIAEAQRADPRQVVCFIGDGAYLYYPHAVYTAARYDIDITVVIANNETYRILKRNAPSLYGGPADSYDIPEVNFTTTVDIAQNVQSHGVNGRRVATRNEVSSALADALSTSGPSVLDVGVRD